MNHPTPEQLKPLLDAVDVACWCLAVKEATKKGRGCPVDVKGALQDLREAWDQYQVARYDIEAMPSEASE